MSERPRIVVFDAGGVLVRICRTWSEGCAAAGLDVRAEPNADDPDSRRLAHEYQAGRISDEHFLDMMTLGFGGLYTTEEIRRVHDAWILGAYAGIEALIDRLARTEGVSTGLLSNTNALHWARMRPDNPEHAEWPMFHALDHPHASHLLGEAKPDEAIYRSFEDKAGFAGSEILFFDDLDENIAAARAAGWRAELIDHTGDTAAQIDGHLTRLNVWS